MFRKRKDINEVWYTPRGKLRKGYLFNINPYTFLLLRKMIQYEAVLYSDNKLIPLTKEIGREEVCDYIESKTSVTFANHVKKFIWNSSAFCFLRNDLDVLCSLITSFNSPKTWTEFHAFYGSHVFAEIAEGFCPEYTHGCQKYFIDLHPNERFLLIKMASISEAIISGNEFNKFYNKHGDILNQNNIENLYQMMQHANILKVNRYEYPFEWIDPKHHGHKAFAHFFL